MVIDLRTKKKPLRLVGETTSRKATSEEMTLHEKTIAGTATPADYAAAGVSAPTSQVAGATGRESLEADLKREFETEIAPKNPGVTYEMWLASKTAAPPSSVKTTLDPGTIDLRTQRENPLDTLLDLKIAKSPLLQALTSPITTAALATTLAVAGGAIALAPTITALTTKSALAVSTAATYGSAIPYNAKNVVLTAGVMTKAGVSAKAIALFGGWAGAVFLGKWGQAEAGEPLSIIMRDVLKEAERTGDWSLYDEAKAARDEITDLGLWEKIALWSPLAPIVGIGNKIRGVLAGAKVMDKLASDKQNFSGEGDDEKWERIRQEQEDSEKGLIEFYNDERKKMVEWEREAKVDARDDDARFWRKERAKQDKKEEESTKRNGEFWVEYRKEAIKLEEDAAARSADFWLDYNRRKQDIAGGGTGAPTTPGAPAPTGTSRTFTPGSSLKFGLLEGKGYYTEEEKKKK